MAQRIFEQKSYVIKYSTGIDELAMDYTYIHSCYIWLCGEYWISCGSSKYYRSKILWFCLVYHKVQFLLHWFLFAMPMTSHKSKIKLYVCWYKMWGKRRPGAMMHVASYTLTTDDLYAIWIHLHISMYNTVLTFTNNSAATWIGLEICTSS